MTRNNGPRVFNLNLVDAFASIGGLTVGFRDDSCEPAVQFVPRLMVDIDQTAREVAQRNMPDVPYLVADVHQVTGDDIMRRAGVAKGEPIHILVGGPPCQGFSGLGKRTIEDDRNLHILDFLRLVRELNPLIVLMENVPQVITSYDGAIVNEVCDSLGSLGYACSADILIASDFGVPQFRKRAFVLAYRSDMGMAPQFPRRTHERIAVASHLMNFEKRIRFEADKLPYVSVEEAIGDLPLLRAGEGDEVEFYSGGSHTEYQAWARNGSVAVFNHRARAHANAFLEKLSVIQEGGRNMDLPESQRFSDNYFSQAYARLHRAGIAQTVTTHFSNPGSGRFLHYRELRSITVREAARFQSFQDSFIFDGDHATQMRHVGNAVPPLLARALRDQIARDYRTYFAGVQGNACPVRTQKVENPIERSRIMRAVTSKNSTAEVSLRKAIWAIGLRGYRLHCNELPGKPDLVFKSSRVAVFVDGCFWHGCARCYRAPKTNDAYWQMKVNRNRERDKRTTKECRARGWRVVRLWEHDILRAPDRCARKLAKIIADRDSVRMTKRLRRIPR